LLSLLVCATLLILVPQLLRARQQFLELQHAEHLKAIEQGMTIPPSDERSRSAGRTAVLVPIVVVCAAATVTCFFAASKSDNMFAITLAVWCPAAVIGLAAITGGVSLIARLAQLQFPDGHEELPENPFEKKVNPPGES